MALLVGALGRLVDGEEGEAEGNAGHRHEQSVAPVVGHRDDENEDEDADGLGQRIAQVVPAENTPPALGWILIGQVRVVHGVIDTRPDGCGQVKEGEGPYVGREGHQRSEHREDEQREGGHHLAAAPVGQNGQGHCPEQLGDLGDECHRSEGGVVDVEGVLEVLADDGDAVAEGARHHGRPCEQDKGCPPVLPQYAEERR